ncbi:MAG: diacylglycerol kinase family lipid kinase, partial [Lachnospiraceae bacterium]|nr:diacylglycerol kinase family lipid kinase [Lachnospiraceae bacterium]
QRSNIKTILNKIKLGKLCYVTIALKQLLFLKRCGATITVDGHTTKLKRFYFIANMIHRYEGGGFMFCPDATGDNGLINQCVVGDFIKPLVPVALPKAFKGEHYSIKGITKSSGTDITIETTKPVWIHTDGEVHKKSSHIKVSISPAKLRLICPDESGNP